MKIEEYEQELKAINPELSIKVSPQAPDMAGIYYKDIFITGIPSGEVFPERREEYKSEMGVPHKTSEVATAQVKQWLSDIDEQLKLDSEFRAVMKEKSPLKAGALVVEGEFTEKTNENIISKSA